MPIAFSRSMRSCYSSNFRGAIVVIFVAAIVLAGWMAWALQARLSLYEISDTARLEVENAAHLIEAPLAGKIIANHLVVGQKVQAGQVLVELDADTQRLQLQEEQTQPTTLSAQTAALGNEIASEKKALDEARKSAGKVTDEARVHLREATVAAQFARTEAERLATLYKGGFIAELEYLQAKAKAEEQEAVAERMRIVIGRLEQEHLTVERDRQTRIEGLKGEITKIASQMSTDRAAIKRLEHEVQTRQIQAPISGRVGEVADLRIGSFVNEGAKLGTIIPEGGIRVVAYFPPQSALGRIQPGQAAQLRLDGFPWSQYGSLSATVTTVAGEVKDGHVRVELEIRPDQASPIPLQHGLPGTVEIEVKRVSPLMLVLQYVEKSLTTKRSTAE